jgi:hypothetical protein
MNGKERVTQPEQRAELAKQLLAAYRAGLRLDSGADMPTPQDIVGDAFDELSLPRAANPNSTLAETFQQWLAERIIALLRRRDPRLRSDLLEIRHLVFFYFYHVEEFLSNAQLSGRKKKRGRFSSVEDLQRAWEQLTGLTIAHLPRLSPEIKASEQNVTDMLPISTRTATNSIESGLWLVFGIEEGRAHVEATDLSSSPAPPRDESEEDTPASILVAPPASLHHTPPPVPALPPDPHARQDFEALVYLVRSVSPQQAFSEQSLAFALNLSIADAGVLLDRWWMRNWVVPAGRLHGMDAYVIPPSSRREALALLRAEPALGMREATDFLRMSSLLKPASPISPPYRGTEYVNQFATSRSPSIRAWSSRIIDEMATLGTVPATEALLQERNVPLLVDRLSTLHALAERSQRWLRYGRWVIVAAIAVALLFGASFVIFRSEAMQTVTTACGVIALFMLLYAWGVLHQTARAWQVFWAEAKV